MNRRAFLGVLSGSLLDASLAAEAQPTGKRYRIGFLGVGSASDPRFQRFFEVFRNGLAELGQVEGQTSLGRALDGAPAVPYKCPSA
jgi:hypothetical protein